MFAWFINNRLDAFEKQLGVSLDYMRYMYRVAPGAFFAFGKVMPLAKYRKALPVGPLFVASLVATKHEDCGTCVQIGVNLAKKEGVDPQVIQAVVDGKPEALSEDLAEAYRFAEAVVTMSDEQESLREAIRRRYGDEGLVEMSLGITVARMFPTVKRALGYATCCSLVSVKV